MIPWLNSNTSPRRHRASLNSRNNSAPPAPGYPWPQIYEAQLEYKLTLPGGLDLFSRNPSDANLEDYFFPVLLADSDFGSADLVDLDKEYINTADEIVGQATVRGLEGIQCDNTFFAASGANHLHFDEDHLQAFVGAKNGTLTYSINHLEPAIPQLAANVWYLDAINQKLAEIDDDGSCFGDGTDGDGYGQNLDHELISVNANEPAYGGSKYGIMRADNGGFESSIDRFSNRSDRSQNFRRTMARDKNMSRLIAEVDSAKCMLSNWSNCANWTTLWGDEDEFRTQVMYEAAWIALAWGFMPSITAMFRGDFTFYDTFIKPIFGDDTIPVHGLALTSIFRELHVAGWRPRTQVAIEYTDNKSGVDLYVERFGDSGISGNAVYFTVLNNDGLCLTCTKLAKMFASGEHAEKSIDEIQTPEEFEEYQICEKDFECNDFPIDCPTSTLKDLHKEFFLNIHKASTLGLMITVGNIKGIQLVYRPENSTVCNWSLVQDWAFTEGWQSDYYSIWRIAVEDKLRIGGPWPTIIQQPLSIEDKVLYVFKLWNDPTVDNGDGGGEGDGSRSGTEGTEQRNSHYERYGSGWQTFDRTGYNGSVDAVAVADTEACVYYSINTGAGGELDVLAHFPVTTQATTAAQYDVYVVDYLEGPAREAVLGAPAFTRVIDQSNAEAYATAADEEGFITIGTIDVTLAPMEIKTIVVKLSPAREQESVSPSALLVSDAVMVKQAE